MKWMQKIAVLALIVVFAGAVNLGSARDANAQATFDRSTLNIETADGRHEFDIELALNQNQQAQGLMFRQELAKNAGMLFFHQRERVASMWMRNTFVPLDMLFVARDGRIVHIVERTVPQSLTTITAGIPVRAVLEVNAGTVGRLAIKPGDRLIHPLFGNAE
ncbi:MAG: DUF192 domain-containing protein [Alphaproteobacteria bacterium]|nr:DUF192 domain-containing protein [Alphaproteobacteria bacterium]